MKCALLVWAFVALSGCSLLNAPDRDLTPPDGGIDGGTDGGVDGGGIELFCSDGIDDDDDSATDCEDPDCAEEPACCERRRTTLGYDWTATDLSDAWGFAPGPWTPNRTTIGGTSSVGGFTPADMPHALVSLDCVSLGLGGWIETVLHSTDAGACSAGEPCDDYAAVALTAVTSSTPGSRVQDELSVTLYAGGLVVVAQAGTELARASASVGSDVGIDIELRPVLDESNHPILAATVTVDEETVLEGVTMARTDTLVSSGDCAEIPGLHVAVEGRGSRVFVGPVIAEKQDCANPSQFDEQSATLRASNLEFNPSWVDAYVGAPTLVSSRNVVLDTQWDLMAEGSNWSPTLEPTTHVGYAIGHARIATDAGGNWRLTDWVSSESPKLGDDPPACAEPECEDNRSMREPHLLAELSRDGELRDLTLAFARELVPTSGERDLFGIQVVRPVGPPSTGLALPGPPTVSPDDIPECVSLRDPALIPVDPEAIGGYWVLFTCVEGPSPPRQIHAVRVSRALQVIREGDLPIRRLVLDADELGPFASAGIRAPEPVIHFDEDGLRLRVWFLAQESPGDWSVALAEARTHDLELFELELPEPLPFVVNPIVRSDSPLIQGSCLGEECTISGLAVTRRADDLERLRFLLARRLKENTGAETYQLIPLEQTWRTP